MNDAYLLLGSNIGSRKSYIEESKLMIVEKAGSIITASSLYETEPWGTDNPAPFLNQVIHIKTELLPEQLLICVLLIENELGRSRSEVKNEPRTIDIDILFYGDKVIRLRQLTIPHERLHFRRFALTPLAEIAPQLVHPVLNMTVSALLEQCEDPLWVKKLQE